MLELVPNTVSTLLDGIRIWRERQALSREDTEKRIAAVGEVMRAAVATKAYIYDKKELGSPSREREAELSDAWQTAAGAIYVFDKNLFESSKVKSLGWADPREWQKAASESVTIDLDKIIEQCEWIRENLC